MIKLDSNIEAFNMYIEDKYSELCASMMQDMAAITHLFQGYKVASDAETFISWIKCHHDSVDDGVLVFMPAQLMQMALRKYANLKINGTWAGPNVDQEKLITLTIDMKKINKALKKPVPKKDQAKKLTASTKLQQPIHPEDEWKYVALAAGAPQIKKKGEKQYHWYIHHNEGQGMWMVHVEGACMPDQGKLLAAKRTRMHVQPHK